MHLHYFLWCYPLCHYFFTSAAAGCSAALDSTLSTPPLGQLALFLHCFESSGGYQYLPLQFQRISLSCQWPLLVKHRIFQLLIFFFNLFEKLSGMMMISLSKSIVTRMFDTPPCRNKKCANLPVSAKFTHTIIYSQYF